jgi:AcrR family transcriptional regulator
MTEVAIQNDVREGNLDAIEQLLARYGYKKTTMNDLAREAGIGKGTIYLYFPSKEEVALSSIDRVAKRVQRQIAGIGCFRFPRQSAFAKCWSNAC